MRHVVLGGISRVAASIALSASLIAGAGAAPNDDVNHRNADGSTALQWAVYEGDLDRARRLIADGADVALPNNYGANAMQLAAEVANIDMLKLLLDAGADADSPAGRRESDRVDASSVPRQVTGTLVSLRFSIFRDRLDASRLPFGAARS